jgi:hypothetical protein
MYDRLIQPRADVAHRPMRAFVVFCGERAQKLGDRVSAVPFTELFGEVLPRLARGQALPSRL